MERAGRGSGAQTIDEWMYGLILRYVSYVWTLLTAELLFFALGVDFIVAVFACLYAGRLLNFYKKWLNQVIFGFVIKISFFHPSKLHLISFNSSQNFLHRSYSSPRPSPTRQQHQYHPPHRENGYWREQVTCCTHNPQYCQGPAVQGSSGGCGHKIVAHSDRSGWCP